MVVQDASDEVAMHLP